MKVTLDIPGTTIGASITLLIVNPTSVGMNLKTKCFNTEELRSGEVITIKEGDDNNESR